MDGADVSPRTKRNNYIVAALLGIFALGISTLTLFLMMSSVN